MEADEAIDGLPEVYARALRLRAQGLSDVAIAEALDVPAEAASALLRLAAAKLARAQPPETAPG